MAEPVFEDLGPDEEVKRRNLLQQTARNLKFKADGKANPRGIVSNTLMGFSPVLGLLSALPYGMLAKKIGALLGIGDGRGPGGEPLSGQFTEGGEPLSGQFTEGGSPLPGQFSSQDGSNADIMATLGLPTDTLSLTSKASPLGAVDLSKILFDSALAEQATTPDTFDRTDFATQAMQAFHAAQNDALVNQYGGGPGSSISEFGGFLSDPNARFSAGFDEVGAALAGRGNRVPGEGNPFAGLDMEQMEKILAWRKANPHLQPKYQGPAWEGQQFEGQRPPWLEHYWGGGGPGNKEIQAH